MWAYGCSLSDHQLVLRRGYWIPVRSPSPIQMILKEVESALDNGLFYLALTVALTIPGICAALESPAGSTSGQDKIKYKAWYSANLAIQYPNLTAEDCYSLRCGVVHQGKFGDPSKMQYARVIFTLPNAQNNVFHNNIINDALNLDAVTFCRDIIEAARVWAFAKQNDALVQQNASLLVQLRPNA
jgi:hypothetical protein